jgi:uncharacterized protein (TIGR01777 family)
MIVAISGASGFVGQALSKKIVEKGWTLRIIDRKSLSLQEDEFRQQKIEGADIIVNLAGAAVAKRWTEEWKTIIYESRVNTTKKITRAINSASQKPALLISASAVGIYDDIHTHTETSTFLADSFLAKVCRDWENEALSGQQTTRVVIFRIGVVLGENGGALKKMHGIFSRGLGGKIGNGKQVISFIHLADLTDAMLFAMEKTDMNGIYNAVSPFPVTNTEFTEILGKVLRQPAFLTVPPFALKLMYGEGARILLEGQRVLPGRLLEAGFIFKYPTLRSALTRIY